MRLEEYDYEIEHKPGKEHTNADALSRLDTATEETEINTINIERKPEKEKEERNHIGEAIKKAQREEEPTASWIERIEQGPIREGKKEERKTDTETGQMYLDEQGILCRSWWLNQKGVRKDTHTQVVIPPSMTDTILYAAHDDVLAGHQGIDRTFKRLRNKYWWPRMREETETWVKQCPACQRRDNPKGKKPGLMIPIPIGAPYPGKE